MDSNSTAAAGQSANPRLLIRDRLSLSTFLDGCPHAQTLVAYDTELRDGVIVALDCRQWKCRYCATVRIRKMAAMTRDAQPTRFLTLTVNPALYTSPRDAFDKTRRLIAPFFAKLRQRFGEVEYLRVTELHKSGYPHYHFVVRSNYIPQPVIKAVWEELTGARIVDVRKIQESIDTYRYLTKYLSKMHTIEWTERHVSYSRGFFRTDPHEEKPESTLTAKKMLFCHPVSWCLEHLTGVVIERLRPGRYKFPQAALDCEGF